MAITDQKERYIITMTNGERVTAIASTFAECLQSFGEENVEKIEKLDYTEPKQSRPAFEDCEEDDLK